MQGLTSFGEVLNVLAGFRCDVLDRLPVEDARQVRVSAAAESSVGRGPLRYVLTVEIPRTAKKGRQS